MNDQSENGFPELVTCKMIFRDRSQWKCFLEILQIKNVLVVYHTENTFYEFVAWKLTFRVENGFWSFVTRLGILLWWKVAAETRENPAAVAVANNFNRMAGSSWNRLSVSGQIHTDSNNLEIHVFG